MTAIFKREFRSFFHGMLGYVLTAFLVASSGLYFLARCLIYGLTDFSYYTLYQTIFMLLLYIPVLAMRSLAEERHSRTDQLLLTSPVSIPGIVMGKYLSLLAMFAVPLGVYVLYPLLMKALGAANFAASYSGLLAYFFLGAALIAVCMYLSTLTENQIVAALSGFGVLLVGYLMPAIQTLFTAGSSLALVVFAIILGAASLIIGLRSRSLVLGGGVFAVGCIALAVLFSVRSAALTTAFSAVLGALALFEPFLNFVNGLFDVTALVYYAGVAGLFLFLTGQALEKRRWN